MEQKFAETGVSSCFILLLTHKKKLSNLASHRPEMYVGTTQELIALTTKLLHPNPSSNM